MAVRHSLSTKDKLHSWGILNYPTCSLSSHHDESLDKLFFGCSYSKQIWDNVAKLSCILTGPSPWSQKVSWFRLIFKGKGVPNSVRRLSLVAMVYFVWQERNNRIFKGIQRPRSFVISQITFEDGIKAFQSRNVKIFHTCCLRLYLLASFYLHIFSMGCFSICIGCLPLFCFFYFVFKGFPLYICSLPLSNKTLGYQKKRVQIETTKILKDLSIYVQKNENLEYGWVFALLWSWEDKQRGRTSKSLVTLKMG